MVKCCLGVVLLLLAFNCCNAQKKPLDHSVYDSWESIGEKMISNDGAWVVYSVTVQEGDSRLAVTSVDGKRQLIIPRGYSAAISDDSRFVICKIKPFYKDIREARIRKKKPEEMPKDSLAILSLPTFQLVKVARVKSYQLPQEASGWLAYQLEKPVEKKTAAGTKADDRRQLDSLRHVIDSLRRLIPEPSSRKRHGDDQPEQDFADGADAGGAAGDTGSELVVLNLSTNRQSVYPNVVEYLFSKKNARLVFEQANDPKDSSLVRGVVLFDAGKDTIQRIAKGGYEYRNFAFSEDGSQLAFLACLDAKATDLQKFYGLWYYRAGMDSAGLLVNKNSVGMRIGTTVSEFGSLSFSKSGRRLFFGTAPIQPAKDTTVVEFEQAKLDIWNYKDDYLQTIQNSRVAKDLQANYMAAYDLQSGQFVQLASPRIPVVIPTADGDGARFYAVSDVNYRAEAQWMGSTHKDIYAVNPATGDTQLIKKNLWGVITPQYVSPEGRYIMWYDSKLRQYAVWDGKTTAVISSGIKFPLWNEDYDSPGDPNPYGLMGWERNDAAVLVYDKYDAWKISLDGTKPTIKPAFSSLQGRPSQTVNRYIRTDPNARFVNTDTCLLRQLNDRTKQVALVSVAGKNIVKLPAANVVLGLPLKARDANRFILTSESYQDSPDLWVVADTIVPTGAGTAILQLEKLSWLNPQQANYNWGTAALFHWQTFKGKQSEGILYKPENFDATKKYPLLIYFYEELSDGLNSYIPPAPTASRLNISFFVSRGYVVFAPDIKYTVGHPGQSAYDYIVSGAKALLQNKWIDGDRIGIQGQSWGGYQVAQLITMTTMFKAAWAGAPVANMTSAYGGIRWESGNNRQSQYEKGQSRIGATLWQRPDLYIENSPLFHLPKVKTPLVIMSNDADGAVPWYQGIELFTAMKRLGKPVWLLQYNGEAHNLVERRNRKDIQVREQQYFDWLLKDAAPPRWITEGVPAVQKGKEYGLETNN